MKLWLHIGSPKTGSSSIQSFLHANRDRLSAEGVVSLVPAPRQTSANRLAAAIGQRSKFDAADVAGDCFARIKRDRPSDAILSSEEFYLEDPARVAAVLTPHIARHRAEVQIVIYLRRQDLFIDSFYSQRRKTGRFRGSLHAFIERFAERELNYARMIALWQTAFPGARIHLRRFERARFPQGDIIRDFMALIGHRGDEAGCVWPEIDNASPNRDVIALMDLLAETGGYNTTRIYRLMEQQGFPDTGARKTFVDDATRQVLLDHYAPGNERLRAAFFPDEDSLFDMTGPKPEDRPETTLSPEMLGLLKSLFAAIAKA